MNDDPELLALATVYSTLKGLDGESQQRVLDYVSRKLGLQRQQNPDVEDTSPRNASQPAIAPELADYRVDAQAGHSDEDNDGISPIALKWIRRNNLTVEQLGHLFSLGTEEIDLVAKNVPGKSKNARTRSVTLLKGIAAYLSSGTARITDEQIKEACLHYNAYDSPHHATYLKGMSTELTGSKSSGFVLTARGLAAGTELVREILGLTEST